MFCFRRVKFDRRSQFPAMKEQLHIEFRELRRKGVKVKAWWFKARAKKILESHPNACTFKYSDGWFTRFKCRYNISFRKPTNTAQRAPSEKEETIQEFHRQIREVQFDGESDGPQEERFKLLTWIRLPSLFRLLVAQLTKQPTHPQCGSVVEHLDSTRDNAWHNLPSLPTASQG